MFCDFQGPPKIPRLYGQGRVIEPGEPGFQPLASRLPAHEGIRAIILAEVSRIADSCGFGVPLLKYEGRRSRLPAWSQKLGPDGLDKYRQEKNRSSIDRVPGLDRTRE
jgi:hypothetical protein